MSDYTILLVKILGKEKNEELFNYTIKRIKERFGDIKIDRALEIVQINHQILLIISILKAEGLKDEKIIDVLEMNRKKNYKYIIVDNYEEFVYIYQKYIKLIISYLNNFQ